MKKKVFRYERCRVTITPVSQLRTSNTTCDFVYNKGERTCSLALYRNDRTKPEVFRGIRNDVGLFAMQSDESAMALEGAGNKRSAQLEGQLRTVLGMFDVSVSLKDGELLQGTE